MNNCVFIGNLTRDPELKYVGAANTPLCTFTLAVNDRQKGKDGEKSVYFFDFEAWGKTGELMSQFLSKGRQVSVVSKAVQQSWEDQEGKKRTKVRFKVSDFSFVNDGKNKATESDTPSDPEIDVDHPF